MFSHQSGRKRGISQADRPDGDEQQAGSRGSKTRRLSITAPSTLPPLCTFTEPVPRSPAFMPSYKSSTSPLNPEPPKRSTTPNKALRYETFLSLHGSSTHKTQLNSSRQGHLLHGPLPSSYNGIWAQMNYENMPAYGLPLSTSRRASLRTILAVSKSRESPSQLSQSEVKNHNRTTPALVDLSQALARLCTVDERDELTSTNSESEPMVSDDSFNDLSLSSPSLLAKRH